MESVYFKNKIPHSEMQEAYGIGSKLAAITDNAAQT